MTADNGRAPGFNSLTPYIIVRDVDAALDWYARAFAAEPGRLLRMPGGGPVVYAELRVAGSMLMLADADERIATHGPESFGGSPVMLHLYVPDVDAAMARAVQAGAVEERAVADQFFGDRSGMVKDPFGYVWSLATHKRTLSDEDFYAAWERVMGADALS
ncbi:MAG: VOC family protein [Rhodothalassiaceae bacterium]